MAQDNVDVIQGAWDALGRGDIDKATAVADPSAEIVVPDTVPWGGTYHGPEGWQELMANVRGHWEKFDPKPEKVLGADDDHVIVVARLNARAKGGEEFDSQVVWVYKMRNGQVLRAEAFLDSARVRDTLG